MGVSSFYCQDIKFDSITVDKSGQIKWLTLNEKVNMNFDIEEFHWNKWETIGKVSGQGNGSFSYSFLADTACGLYQVRVSFGQYHSKTINYPNPVKINVISGCSKPIVKFGRKTKFEVYDQYGKKIAAGCDSVFDIKNLKKGQYFLNAGDKLTEFIKH